MTTEPLMDEELAASEAISAFEREVGLTEVPVSIVRGCVTRSRLGSAGIVSTKARRRCSGRRRPAD